MQKEVERESTCELLGHLKKNIAVAYNNVIVERDNSVMKAQKISMDLETKDIIINSDDKIKVTTEYIENKSIQSKTVIVADTEKDSDYFIENLRRKNLIIGKGYGSTNNQIRIANFPAHSKESIELLCDELTKLQ